MLHDESFKITLDAHPSSIEIEVSRTAVLVVDMQNDFGSENGMFHRSGIDISGIRQAIGPIASVLNVARVAHLPIVYIKMGFHADLSNLGEPGSANRERHLFHGVGDTMISPDGSISRILIRDSWNTDVIAELAPQPEDIIIYKHRFSAFFETELDSVLKSRGIQSLIVTGCTTSVCVESTVRDAFFRDYRTVVLKDCTAEPIGHGTTNFDATLLLIERLFGWVSDSATVKRAFENAANQAFLDESRLEQAAAQ